MSRPLAVVVVSVSCAAGLVACQGVFNVDFDKAHLDGGASSSGTSGAGSSGGEVPNPTMVGTIAGKWDLSGSLPGEKAETGTLDVGPNTFRVAIGGAVLDFSAAGDRTLLTYTRYGEGHVIDVDHREAAVSWGVLPISKGGVLTFKDPGNPSDGCTLELGAPNGSLECPTRPDGWPNVLPRPISGVRYEMTRVDPQPSSFGDLGGHWRAKSVRTSQVCTIDFLGDKISAVCPDEIKQIGGKFDATFGSDMVSGRLSGGVEFAGQKR